MNELFNFLIVIDRSEINAKFFLEDPQGNEALPSLEVKSRNDFFKKNPDIDEQHFLSLEDRKRMLFNKTFHQKNTGQNLSSQRVFLLYFYYQNFLFVNLVGTDIRLK